MGRVKVRIFSRPVMGWQLRILRTKNRLKNWAKRRRASFWCDMLGHEYGLEDRSTFYAWFQDSPHDIFTAQVTRSWCKRCSDERTIKTLPAGRLRRRTIVFGNALKQEENK